MSAVPASAEQAGVGARARRARPRASSPCRTSHSTSPGSTLPERVAITMPSSGVKPIVVSTERPSADRGERGAGAEVAGDDPRAARQPEQLGRAPRGVGVREAVEAVAAQRRSARATRAAPRRSRPRRAGRRGTRCRSRRRPAARAAPRRGASIAASALGWCSGASGVSARSSSTQRVVDPRGLRAAAAVDDAVRDRVRRRRAGRAPRRARPRRAGRRARRPRARPAARRRRRAAAA